MTIATASRPAAPAAGRIPHRRRAVSVGVAALAVLALAGCGGAAPDLPDGRAPVADPRPVGAQDPAVVPSGSAPPEDSCDPLASLRPRGAKPAPGRMPAGSTMARIVERGRLIVGVDQNSYLFGFRDPRDGELTGFDIDVAREIARDMFGDPKRIQFRAISSAERIPLIRDGSVDLVVKTMTMNCERWQQVAFSTEYFTAGQRVLVTRDSPAGGIGDLGGQKVCAAAGTTSLRNIAQAPSRPIPVSVVNWTDCLVMLQQNQVAAISTDDAILAGLTGQDPNTKVVGPRFSAEPYGVAVARSSPDLVRFVNSVLERVRADGTWTRLYERWLTALGPAPAPPVARYQD
nr:glutamate ABC transporter substrate-binding protein [Micromonospora sp. DSM 115978]